MKKKLVIIPCVIAVVLICSVLSVRFIKTTKINNDFIYNGYSSEFVFDDERYTYTKNLSPKITDKNKSVNFDIEMFSEKSKHPMYSDGMNVYFLTDNDGIYYYDENFNIHCLMPEKKNKLRVRLVIYFQTKVILKYMMTILILQRSLL